MASFEIRTPARCALLDVTAEVMRLAAASGLREGLCVVSSPHTTCGVTVNEGADPDVAADILETLARLVPRSGSYRHAEGNSDAHVKTLLTGTSVTLPLASGRPLLGTWQRVFLAEFDGPRTRTLHVTCVGRGLE